MFSCITHHLKNRKNAAIILLLLCSCSISYSQAPPKIDSLEATLNNTLHDTVRVSTLNQLFNYYFNKDIEKATSIANQMDEISERIKWDKGIADSKRVLGICSYMQSDYAKALEYWLASLEVNEKRKDKTNISVNLANIGMIYRIQQNDEKALEYYERSLKLAREMGRKEVIASSLGNMGLTYKGQGKLDKALEYQLQALAVNEELDRKTGIATNLTNIGSIYTGLKKYDEAIPYQQRALSLMKEINDKGGVASNMDALGRIYIKLGEFKKAEQYLDSSRVLAAEVNDKNRLMWNNVYFIALYDTLAQLATSNADKAKYYELAYKNQKEYTELRDSIFNESKSEEMGRLTAKAEYDKKQSIKEAEHKLEIENQKKLAEEERKRKNIIILGAGIGLALLLSFLLFLLNRYRLIRKQKQTIELQKILVDQKNMEITDSITYAKRIQNAILPSVKNIARHFKDFFIVFKPKDIVAGDFYWLEHKEGKVLFAAADCTGHGVPGAMVSVVCNNGLNRSVREFGLTDPGKILDKTREIVVQEFEKSVDDVKDGMDIALCSLEGNTLQYAGANNPLWIIRNGETIETKANKQPIGKFDNPTPYTTHTFELQKGDTIYIFSDGYLDQFGGDNGKKFKPSNFRKLLLSIQQESMEQQKKIIDNAFFNWKGDLEQIDDVCIIGVRV